MSRKLGGKAQVAVELTKIEENGLPEDVAAENMSISTDLIEKQINLPRASSLHSSCIRMHVLATQSEEVVTERLGFDSRITFGIGNAIHHWAQNTSWMFPPHMRIGWWRCTACGQVRRFGPFVKGSCPHCNAGWPAQIYKEHRTETKEPYPCSGHPDLFIKKGEHFRVVELKTIASSGFKELIAPTVEHEWQIQYYMWACSNDTSLPANIDPAVGYIIYISKGALWKALPIKMFPVVRSERILNEIKEKLSSYHDSLENGTLPEPWDVCVQKKFTGSISRQCSMRKECQEQHQS